MTAKPLPMLIRDPRGMAAMMRMVQIDIAAVERAVRGLGCGLQEVKMAAAPVVVPEGWMSVSEYLQSSFEPDADYVDGFIEKRNLGELDHSTRQGALCVWFAQHRAELHRLLCRSCACG